jgi:hypothetical protein
MVLKLKKREDLWMIPISTPNDFGKDTNRPEIKYLK